MNRKIHGTYPLLPSALLEKEHKDKDEKMSKIKAVAIKAKKELDISKKEVERLIVRHQSAGSKKTNHRPHVPWRNKLSSKKNN